jgi:hydrogenase/urease accessory protein HupE
MLSKTRSLPMPGSSAKWAVVTFAVCSAAVHAHEIGTSRAAVTFEQHGKYNIELVTDAVALVEKLEATSGSPKSMEGDPFFLQSVLSSSDESFRRRVKIRFDDVEVRPVIAYAVTPGSNAGAAPIATIRFTGQVPSGARQFSWAYAWTFASYALTVRNSDANNPSSEWLEGGQTSKPVTLAAPSVPFDRMGTVWRYLTLGFTHIFPNGLDHMLFVIGIYLLSGRARSVFWQVSAFTVAHSITLGLSMYGVMTVSPRIVEPMIALSIAYVAIENIFLSELKTWRVALVFCFGLLHGLGFAGALKELDLPHSEFVTALVTFNIGVEAGQLAVIATAFVLVGWYCNNRTWYRSRIVVPASMMIACTAVYWVFERLAS